MEIKNRPEFVQEMINRTLNTVSVSEVMRVYSVSLQKYFEELDDDALISVAYNANFVDIANKFLTDPNIASEEDMSIVEQSAS